MGIALADIEPFIFTEEQGAKLYTEHLKHSSFQRRPLIRSRNRVIVALPTAIGSAVVRYTIECALRADDMAALEMAVTKEQGAAIWRLGVRAWEINDAEPPPVPGAQLPFLDTIGRFDRDCPVHLIYVPDNLAAVASDGFQSLRTIGHDVVGRMERVWTKLSARPEYRGGLTIMVHGGAGRSFHSEFLQTPVDWHILALPVADFMLLAWDQDLSALRTWKILEQEQRLAERGLTIQNLSGFPNLYGFLRDHDFMMLPYDCDPQLDLLPLPTDSVASLRRFLRTRLDSHGVVGPSWNAWLQVQRMDMQRDPVEDRPPPIYISPDHAAGSHLAACVEPSSQVWWMTCSVLPESPLHRHLTYMIWQMALNWLVPVASLLEQRLHLDPRRPIVYLLRFPGIEDFSPRRDRPDGTESPPMVRIHQGRVVIDCTVQYLRAFASDSNVGEKMMVTAMLRGANLLVGSAGLSSADTVEQVEGVMGSGGAQYFSMTSSRTPEEAIYATVPLPQPRFPSPEDRAWSTIDLARIAGWSGPCGLVPNPSAQPLMADAVEAVWRRIRNRLVDLDRRSVLQRALLNAAAVQKDRMEWRRFSSAILSMAHDEHEIRKEGDAREARRALSALASRVTAEMALCTSPTHNGAPCTERDFDTLLAEVATLLACAVQNDAIHYGLLTSGVMVHANGSFGFDPSIQEIVYPYASTLRAREIWDAAGETYRPESSLLGSSGQAAFESAFVAEFGLGVTQYLHFIDRVADRLVQQRTAYAWVRRTEIIQMLEHVNAKDPAQAFAALLLVPRDRWDETNPGSGCERRDWYPWRYGRRLSVLRRPLIQLSNETGSDVLLMPSLLEAAARYLLEARTGQLAKRLFESEEMRSWIGTITNQLGHAFNETVAAKLRDLGWKARVEVKMTELGGSSELGDVDVLAWRTGIGPVYAIECKRLMYDRTVGEIGRRLRDYTDSRRDGHRTPIQKTLDRLELLMTNPSILGKITDFPVTKTMIRSALVTDDITPMQFSQHVKGTLDVVVEYGGLADYFRDE